MILVFIPSKLRNHIASCLKGYVTSKKGFKEEAKMAEMDNRKNNNVETKINFFIILFLFLGL
jgi:uncharacterized protein YehS (DUF1456 family)